MATQSESLSLTADFLTREETAKACGLSLRSLARLEAHGDAPPSLQLGAKRRCRYRRETIRAWLDSREGPTRVRKRRTRSQKRRVKT
jgi:predicted DNA-binding transcriptional regulator AlpA